jgi:hypothetical protein
MEYCQKDYIWTKIPANNTAQKYESGTVYYAKNVDENTGVESYYKIRPSLNEDLTFISDVYTKEPPETPTLEDD